MTKTLTEQFVEAVTINERDLVDTKFSVIKNGMGWATDTYVVDQLNDLNDRQKLALMKKLAASKMLFDESALTPEQTEDGEKPSAKHALRVKDAVIQFQHLVGSSAIDEFVNAVKTGAGWCTAEYVTVSGADLADVQQLAILRKLAKLGLLHDEEKLSDAAMMGDEDPDKSSAISPRDVDKDFKYLFEAKQIEVVLTAKARKMFIKELETNKISWEPGKNMEHIFVDDTPKVRMAIRMVRERIPGKPLVINEK